MLRFETAGESHGECLVATLTGLPAGIPISLSAINRELWRRQQGYGRGGRMKIETDTAEIVAGVRHSHTIGSPLAIIIRNADWKNWSEILPVEGVDQKQKPVTRPRPGHADLAGAIKYNFHDARYILERASARESSARVAAGALAKLLLRALGIEVLSHVVRVGAVDLERPYLWEEIVASNARETVVLNCIDPDIEQRMKGEVDKALRTGDTVGGVFEVVAHASSSGHAGASHDDRPAAEIVQGDGFHSFSGEVQARQRERVAALPEQPSGFRLPLPSVSPESRPTGSYV